jgi:hypothetical protein
VSFKTKGEDLTVRLAFNLLLFCPGKHDNDNFKKKEKKACD